MRLDEKVGRNDPCPCGSGQKYKKCCLRRTEPTHFSREERESALAKLAGFVERALDPEEGAAFEEFWGRWAARCDEIDRDRGVMSEQVFELWFAFDRPLDDGKLVVDRFMKARILDLSVGERRYLETLRASSMRLYEVEDSRPGESLSLRDVVEDDRVTVQERSGSRSLNRFDWLATRVVAAGASGKPELEGVLPIPDPFHQPLRDQLRRNRDAFLREHPAAGLEAFYKTMPPLFQDVWAGALLEPVVPRLANTDGEELVVTEVVFEVLDRDTLMAALADSDELERDEHEPGLWRWSGKNGKDEVVSLGRVALRAERLVLEANSVARGQRGRALLESTAGAALRHLATAHQDMQRIVREEVRRTARGEGAARPEAPTGIPPEVQEALVLDLQARHYRSWLDQPVPALDGKTPRVAAADTSLRPRLVELLRDLDRMYQRALKAGEPAFDPSWMWDELDLGDGVAAHPPPLAHERVSQLVPDSGIVCHSIAEARRRQPGFDDASTVLTEDDLGTNLDLQRLIRERGRTELGAYLGMMVNFELHRRKSFWVDEALAYMLAHTDLEARGDELRLPFASFALVFTDRHVLSLAERMLARRPEDPLAGHYLQVATVYVTEHRRGDERTIRLCFALDALGADLPSLVVQEIPLAEDQGVESFLDSVAPPPAVQPAIPSANPIRGLLQVAMNAILYATSAGVEPAARRPPASAPGRNRLRGNAPVVYSSEEVFFLPGAIEISQVRRLQDLERVPDGRTMLRRFMVRGHWRRPAQGWTDQRRRWISPYWKGPDMAAIIERTYKLKP